MQNNSAINKKLTVSEKQNATNPAVHVVVAKNRPNLRVHVVVKHRSLSKSVLARKNVVETRKKVEKIILVDFFAELLVNG